MAYELTRPIRPDWLFKASAVAYALAAYAILGVPSKYLGWLFLIGAFFAFRVRAASADIWRVLQFVLTLIVVCAIGNVLNLTESWAMADRATTSYSIFVSLRYLEILAFWVALYVTYRIARTRGTQNLLDFYVKLGLVVASYALYAWVAQQYGLWELPRTRIGTGGQDFLNQSVTFQYGFHRALGSFREPSHLAQWLILPLFACLVRFDRRVYPYFVVMLGAFLLTGSVLGLGMAACGVAVLITRRWRGFRRVIGWRWLISLCLVTFVAAHLSDFSLLDTVSERIAIFFHEGISGTNRSYILEYFSASPPAPLGYGLGNASIRLGEWMGSDLTASHLSAFLHYLYAGGVGALFILVALLAFPFLRALSVPRQKRSGAADILLAVHGAWVFSYFFHAETLDAAHAMALGLFFAVIRDGEAEYS